VQMQDMLESHPWPRNVDRQMLAECIEECYACAQACTSCADACLSEDMVADLRKCVSLNLYARMCARSRVQCSRANRATTRRPRGHSSKLAGRRAGSVQRSASDTPGCTSTAGSAPKPAADASRHARRSSSRWDRRRSARPPGALSRIRSPLGCEEATLRWRAVGRRMPPPTSRSRPRTRPGTRGCRTERSALAAPRSTDQLPARACRRSGRPHCPPAP
jgi:hypothetical protein